MYPYFGSIVYLHRRITMLKGSHTIEAAFIMPIVLSTIWGIVYLTLYLYDYSLIEQSAYLAAFRGSNKIQDNQQIEREVEKQGDELLEGKLLLNKSKIEEIHTNGKKTSVSYHYSDNLIVIKEVTHFQPVNQIRAYRKLEKFIKNKVPDKNKTPVK